MPAFRPVVFVGGILVLILAALMVIPALYEWAAGAARASQYLPCIAVPAFLGTVAVLGARGGPMKLGLREAYLLTSSRSEEHTSELQSLMRISYAVFCLKKKKPHT